MAMEQLANFSDKVMEGQRKEKCKGGRGAS